jgi:hypothetical protein
LRHRVTLPVYCLFAWLGRFMRGSVWSMIHIIQSGKV